MRSPKFELFVKLKMRVVVYLICFLVSYYVLSALHALYDPLILPDLPWPLSWFLEPKMTGFGSALLSFALTPGLCSVIAASFGKSFLNKTKTKI